MIAMNAIAKPQGCTNFRLRNLSRQLSRHYDAEVAKSGRRKPRLCIKIESDLPAATTMASWERELLLPVVMGLLDDVLGGYELQISSDDHDGDD